MSRDVSSVAHDSFFTSIPIKKTKGKIPSVHMTSPKSDTCVASMHNSKYRRCSKFRTNHMLDDSLKLDWEEDPL